VRQANWGGEFPISSFNPSPTGIMAGPDGALWFTEENGNKIGRLSPGALLPPLAATAHDFNGDGLSDIAWRDASASSH
jgi:streptogramin lyase